MTERQPQIVNASSSKMSLLLANSGSFAVIFDSPEHHAVLSLSRTPGASCDTGPRSSESTRSTHCHKIGPLHDRLDHVIPKTRTPSHLQSYKQTMYPDVNI